MTPEQLKQTISNTIAILQDNKNVVTPNMLTTIEKLVDSLSPNENIQTILNDAKTVIDMEKRLIETTDNLIEILTQIQNHPIIIRLIARIL